MSTQTLPYILAISGSLRKQSINTHLLKACADLASQTACFHFYEELEQLPPFNPDFSEEPKAVSSFRKQLSESDAILICTPEYAFGIPGVLKNALDWVVSTGEFNEKPIAVITASPLTSGGDKAMASLLNTLTALGTKKDEHSALSIGAIKKKINEQGEIIDHSLQNELSELMNHLLIALKS